jgi:hypothetical protein
MNQQGFVVCCSRVMVCVCGLALAAAAQVVERASVGSGAVQANQASQSAQMSSDGRFVVFSSYATNLVASDTNGAVSDTFVRDRTLQTTELVSLSSSGQQGAEGAYGGVISDDGRYVAFLTNALLPGDTDFPNDVYLRDRATGITSVLTPNGSQTTDFYSLGMSDDGHRVAYFGYDWNGSVTLAVVVDHTTAQSWQWSGAAPGPPSPSSRYSPPILSGDGRYVFLSYSYDDGYGNAYNKLTRFDTQTAAYTNYLINQYVAPVGVSRDGRWVLLLKDPDLLRFDVANGTLETITATVDGAPPTGYIARAAVSDDGRYVAFTSDASNLVAGDTNGKSDAFVRDCFSHATVRVSESAAGAQANHQSYSIDMTGDASLVVFDGLASNLVLGDTNSAADVFTRTNCFAQYADGDGDGYGAMLAPQLVCLPSAGWSLNALDCDDTNAARHPGAPDLLDGVDNDCDGSIDEDSGGATYCTAGTSFYGCLPQISAVGAPSASASSGYTVVVQSVPGQRNGMILYGLAPAATPWGTNGSSFACVAPPRQRTAALSTGGTQWQCNGQLTLDVQAWFAAHPGALGAPLQAGQTLYFQGWYRDQGAPNGSSLSAGWVVRFGP